METMAVAGGPCVPARQQLGGVGITAATETNAICKARRFYDILQRIHFFVRLFSTSHRISNLHILCATRVSACVCVRRMCRVAAAMRMTQLDMECILCVSPRHIRWRGTCREFVITDA